MLLVLQIIVVLVISFAMTALIFAVAVTMKNILSLIMSERLAGILAVILISLALMALHTYRKCGSFWSCKTSSETTECQNETY